MDLLELEGKHTVESLAKQLGIKKTSTLNLLSRLKKQRLATVTGGGRQKRIYTISRLPQVKTNGFYDVVNKFSKIKLVPSFKHIVHGHYTIEQAIIDGIEIGDARTLEATTHLFRHIKNWKRLFDLAKKHEKTSEVKKLYEKARKSFKCRKMPKRYEK